MAKEKTLQTLILEDLESRAPAVFVFKLMKANINGLPDVWFIYSGGLVCIEVKAPGERPEDHQQLVINRINATGGAKAYWCDSWKMWSEIKKELF
jgi:hypothetical protein